MISRRITTRVMMIGTAALLIAVLGVVLTPSANGYESSIYAAYHLGIWVAFAVSFASFLVLVLKPQYRTQAIVGIATLYGLLFSLPIVRGYVLVANPLSDIVFHLGIISDIVATGTVPYLFYPAMHILFSTIKLITGIGDMPLQSVSGVVLITILILGFMSLIGRFLNRTAWPYAFIAAIPLMYGTHHISAQPWFFALVLVPLIVHIALWNREELQRQQILLIIVLGAALIIYHPFTTIFTITILIATGAMRWLSWQHSSRFSATMSLTIGVGLMVWLVYSSRFETVLYQLVVSQIAPGGGVGYVSQAGSTDVTIWRVFEVIITQWGTAIIYTGIGGAIVLTLVVCAWRMGLQLSNLEQTAIISYTIGIVFAAIFFTAQTFSRNILRILQFAELFSILLIGIALRRLHVTDRLPTKLLQILSDRGRSVILVGLFTCILITGLLGGATLYTNNNHLTEMTVTGTAWHLDHHDRSQPTYSHRMAPNIEIYHHGYTDDRYAERVFFRGNPDLQLPTQLGYDEYATVGKWASDGYLLTTRADIDQGQYTVQDEARLAADSAADRIYANGEYRIWQTKADREGRSES